MLKYMLDTNIVIYTMKNRPKKVKLLFNQHVDQMCISSVTFGEQVYGAEKSQQTERNLADINGLLSRMELLNFDQNAATHFGQLKSGLEKTGNIIGPYDLMIAGHARSQGLILVSNNCREFERIPGLMLENWVDAD